MGPFFVSFSCCLFADTQGNQGTQGAQGAQESKEEERPEGQSGGDTMGEVLTFWPKRFTLPEDAGTEVGWLARDGVQYPDARACRFVSRKICPFKVAHFPVVTVGNCHTTDRYLRYLKTGGREENEGKELKEERCGWSER